MLKYKTKIFISLLAFCLTGQIHANPETSDRFRLDLRMDDNGNLNPESFTPIYWSRHWFSGLGFKENTLLSQDTLDGFDDSKFGTSIDESVLRLNLVSYRSGNESFHYSIGGDYQRTSIDKVEFGYFHLNNGVIDDYIAFDNKVEIEVAGFSMRGDITWGLPSDQSRYRFSAILSPGNSLDVSQNTDFKPIVSTSGIGSNSNSQDINYFLQFETRHRLSNSISIGLDLQYEVLPLNYDAQILSPTVDSFQTITIDNTETTTRVGLRLFFNYPLVNGLYPVIGIANEDVATEDNANGGTTTESQKIVTIGFSGQF